jgi:hypothetical protein
MTTPPSLGQPQPVDDDWRETQEQIDAIVHEHDPSVAEPPTKHPSAEDPPAHPKEEM